MMVGCTVSLGRLGKNGMTRRLGFSIKLLPLQLGERDNKKKSPSSGGVMAQCNPNTEKKAKRII